MMTRDAVESTWGTKTDEHLPRHAASTVTRYRAHPQYKGY